MKFKAFLAKPFASYIHRSIQKGMATAIEDQDAILKELLKAAKLTEFGKEQAFQSITKYEEYKQSIPIRDYEQFKPYINKVKEGRHNILWKGKPIYFAKTSGTTSGVKYIPISKDSISNHINGARNALLCYMAESGNSAFANGKMIFLSGSPELERIADIPTGRLSGACIDQRNGHHDQQDHLHADGRSARARHPLPAADRPRFHESGRAHGRDS